MARSSCVFRTPTLSNSIGRPAGRPPFRKVHSITTSLIQLTEEEFDERYPLLRNHLNPHAGWAYGEENGCLFETYGEELEFVRRQPTDTIWTLVDGDDGDQYVISGFHFVNRIGYLLSTVPFDEAVEIEVRIPMLEDLETETHNIE